MMHTALRLLTVASMVLAIAACQPPPKQSSGDAGANGDDGAQGDGEGSGAKEKKKEKVLRSVDLAAATKVAPESLSKVVEGGTAADAEGNLILDGAIVLEFGSSQKKARRFDWSFDRDDEYQVSFLAGDKVLAERIVVVRDNHGNPEGLWRSDHKIPKKARKGDFDTVYIVGTEGDGKFSIGHFNLIDDVDSFKKERAEGRKARKEARRAADASGAGTDGGDKADDEAEGAKSGSSDGKAAKK